MRPAHRIEAVQSPVIPVVAELIRAHPGTISLGQGVVSYGPPPEAIEQISRFLAEPDAHKYKPVVGLPVLVEAIEAKLKSENGIQPAAESRIVVTAGGNMAFMNAVLALTDPGDEIILQRPYYFNHEMAVTMVSCQPVLVDTDENYQLRPAAIRAAITPRTRAIVTISPNNPTGAVYPEAALREVNEICRERGIHHIHDEAYEYFTYGSARHFSPRSIPGSAGHTISLYSLSKSHGFASWRIGWMVMPERLLTAVKKIQDTILICAPVISQYAAVGALQAGVGYCREKLKAITEVRQIVLNELERIRSICLVPPADGAFYFLLRVDTTMAPMTVVERLVREHGVAVIPGSAFGMDQGCCLRVAYGALEKETAVAGIGRLVKGLAAIVRG
ncbi:MAG TPA: pyridoxal phosphate-dependent aminotransferase [Verrucomicrobiae bacterium]|jgi:aspartate/methionine/tyrosine aminotransferase